MRGYFLDISILFQHLNDEKIYDEKNIIVVDEFGNEYRLPSPHDENNTSMGFVTHVYNCNPTNKGAFVNENNNYNKTNSYQNYPEYDEYSSSEDEYSDSDLEYCNCPEGYCAKKDNCNYFTDDEDNVSNNGVFYNNNDSIVTTTKKSLVLKESYFLNGSYSKRHRSISYSEETITSNAKNKRVLTNKKTKNALIVGNSKSKTKKLN